MDLFKKLRAMFVKAPDTKSDTVKDDNCGIVHCATGITNAEYIRVCEALAAEHQKARERQHPGADKPSAYMKGLEYAMSLLEDVQIVRMWVE